MIGKKKYNKIDAEIRLLDADFNNTTMIIEDLAEIVDKVKADKKISFISLHKNTKQLI